MTLDFALNDRWIRLEANVSGRMHPSSTRILVTDENPMIADKLSQSLRERGFQIKQATTGAEALAITKDWKPHFVLYDLVMADMIGPSFLRQLAADGTLGDDKTRVVVMSAHNSMANVKECLKAGATDYLVKPLKTDDLVSRLIFHMQPKRQVAETKANDTSVAGSALHYMHLTELLLRESLKLAPAPDALYNLVGMLSLVLGAVRVSVIQAALTKTQARVRASSDKRDIDGLTLELAKYPEVVFVLRSEKPLALDNLKADPTMAAIAGQTKSIQFNAMIVVPVKIAGEIWGVVSARLPDSKTTLSDFEIRFAQLTGHVVANVVARDRVSSNSFGESGPPTGTIPTGSTPAA